MYRGENIISKKKKKKRPGESSPMLPVRDGVYGRTHIGKDR